MEAGAAATPAGAAQEPRPAADQPPVVPSREAFAPEVLRAAAGDDLSQEDERSALDWLLGDKPPNEYDITVQYDTPKGRVPVTFVVRQPDGRKIDAAEQQHRNDVTGKFDQIGADVAVVYLATLYITDGSGREISLSSDEFRTVTRRGPDGEMQTMKIASPIDALLARFADQVGLLSGVAREIRKAAGYEPDRIGKAQRRLVVAAGN